MSIPDDNRPAVPSRAVPIRASDADREAVAQVLQNAGANGQLSFPELEERLRLVYRAVTVDELQPVTADLVAAVPAPVNLGKASSGAPPQVIGSRVFAVMSGAVRKGNLGVPAAMTAMAVMGSVCLDLRAATFAVPEIRIDVFTFWGGIEILVADDVDVIVEGHGIMGGFDDRTGAPAPGSRRTLRVGGLAIMGGVGIRRASEQEPRKAVQG